MKEIYFYETKIGKIGIVSRKNKIVEIILNPSICDQYEKKEAKNINEAKTKSEAIIINEAKIANEAKIIGGEKTKSNAKIISEETIIKETKIIKEMWNQIDEYLLGDRKTFSIDYDFVGTEFQKSVWNSLLTIPYGETKSYKEISELVGRPKAFRAVGMANHVNPLPIIVPCHRVIGTKGDLVGYGGGLFVKKFLLDLEHENCR